MTKSPFRSLVFAVSLLVPGGALLGGMQACSTSNPAAAGNPTGNPPPSQSLCATPNETCPCDSPGTEVECGRVDQKFGTYVQCSLGRRTCNGDHKWGACEGTIKVVSKQIGMPLGPLLSPASLQGTGTQCAAGVNDCDPYCWNFGDDSCGLEAGGFAQGDSGEGGCSLVIAPTDAGDAAATATGNFSGNPGGVNGCTGAGGNVGPGNACTTANEYTQCQQDFHCDQASGNCAYSNGYGWVDLRCTGVDLTLGAPCDATGVTTFPICNRGLGTVAAGTALSIYYTNPPAVPDGCTAIAAPADCTVTVPPGAGLGPGSCMDAVGCSAPPGDKFAVINAGNVNLTECTTAAGPACGNNAAWAKTGGGCNACASACRTTVSGVVFDPGENNPLPGVTVFIPQGGLTALPNGVACDTCASVGSPLTTVTFSAVDGAFELDVPAGMLTAIPVVFQTGRWRRQITLPSITACQDNPIPNSGATETRLPRNQGEGDIPFTAIATGKHEAAECLIRRIGVDETEIAAPSQGKRFAVYKDNGANSSPGAPPAANLWASQAALDAYSTVLLPCGGSVSQLQGIGGPEQAYFKNWGDAGGRIFMNHKSAQPLPQTTGGFGFSPWTTTSTWQGENAWIFGGTGQILGSDPIHTQFRTWMTNQGGYGGGNVVTPEPVTQALDPNVANGGFDWVRGAGNGSDTWGANPAGTYELSFSFDMPVGGPNKCGRAIFNGMHVDGARGFPFGTYPTNCQGYPGMGAPMTPNELMFEYLFFELTACTTGVVTASPPPPPPPLPVTTFTRDYHGTCGTDPNLCVVWEAFEWNAATPPGTQILFTAQTAADSSGVPGPFGPAVPIGKATGATTGWTTDACNVDGHLENLVAAAPPVAGCNGVAPAQRSQEWLRVSMEFDPVAQTSPQLFAWQQLYDCQPCK